MVKNIVIVAILISCLLFLGQTLCNGIDKTVTTIKICYPDIALDMNFEGWLKRKLKQ